MVEGVDVYIFDESGNTQLTHQTGIDDMATIDNIIGDGWVPGLTALSSTPGGEPLSGSIMLYQLELDTQLGGYVLYDASNYVAIVSSFYLNGIKYSLPGSNVKIFTLSSTSDLVNAQAAYDWYVNGGVPILHYGNLYYQLRAANSGTMQFSSVYGAGAVSTGLVWGSFWSFSFLVSSDVVTSITRNKNQISLASSAPVSGDNSLITLVI